MTRTRFGVGIIGMQPERSWAWKSHLPAIRSLPDDYELVGIANSSAQSSKSAAEACGLSRHFESVQQLVDCPEVDVVVVTVKVPHHLELVNAALNAGKHVYCEWPLGNGLAEGREMAALARKRGVLGVIGTQANYAEEVLYLRHLIDTGYFGEILSMTLVGTGNRWGPEVHPYGEYLFDIRNGATMLTIPLGHTLAAVTDVFGLFSELSAVTATRISQARHAVTGEVMTKTAEDQILVSGILQQGVPISIHYRGGTHHGSGFRWEINGTEGDLRIEANNGNAQMETLRMFGARGRDTGFAPISVPDQFRVNKDQAVFSGNISRVYAAMARDLRHGTRTAPSFEDGVNLHEILDGIQQSGRTGERIYFGSGR